MNEREIQLAEMPIKKLLWRLSTPAMVGMFVTAFYNIVDTIFIGRGVGVLAIAGVAIVFPINMLVMAIEQTLGIGGSSVISRLLGERNYSRAQLVFNNLASFTFLSGIFLTILILIFLKPILVLFGATENILPYALEYGRIIVYGISFFSFSMVGNNVVRSEGNARVAMLTMLIGAVINLILDPIFIFVFGWGLAGAAWATVISQSITFLYIFSYFFFGDSILKFSWQKMKIKLNIILEIVKVGISSFFRMGSGALISIVLNNSLAVYGGDIAIATFGIINRLISFAFLPIIGVVQGMQPIVGYNFGAGAFDRVRKTLSTSVVYTTAMSVVAFLFLFLFPRFLLRIFTDDITALDMGTRATRIIILAYFGIGFQMVASGMYQSLGRAAPALFLSILRQIVLLIPLIIILPIFFYLDGIWFSFPIADFGAFVITFFMYRRQMKKLFEK